MSKPLLLLFGAFGTSVCISGLVYSALLLKSSKPSRKYPEPKRDDVFYFKEPDHVANPTATFGVSTTQLFFPALRSFCQNWRVIDWRSWTKIKLVLRTLQMGVVNSIASLITTVIWGRTIRNQKLNQRPVFILGHFRSGTTLLHHMLGLDSDQFYFFNTFHGFIPHMWILIRNQLGKMNDDMSLENRMLDNIRMDMLDPQEDSWAADFLCGYGVNFRQYFIRNAKFYEDRFLAMDKSKFPNDKKLHKQFDYWTKCLIYAFKSVSVFENPDASKRLLSKSPFHTARVKLLLEIFPDAQFIFLSRDPYRVFRSFAKLCEIGPLYTDFTSATNEEIQESNLHEYEVMMKSYLEARDLIPEENLIEIKYEEFSKDKIGHLKMIYEKLGWEGFDQAKVEFEKYTQDKKDYKKNEFEELSQPLKEKIYNRWKFFFDEFGYQKQH